MNDFKYLVLWEFSHQSFIIKHWRCFVLENQELESRPQKVINPFDVKNILISQWYRYRLTS